MSTPAERMRAARADELGRAAYDRWVKSYGGRNPHTGYAADPWDELDDPNRERWMAVAAAVEDVGV